MLEINEFTQEYLDKVKAFAKSIGKEAEFQEKLDYFEKLTWFGVEAKTSLYKDSSPYSFSFTVRAKNRITDQYDAVMNGGLIYYGPYESGSGAPQFSVSLDTSNEARWEIHT
jgi:ABC-type Fe3+-citrate transport system substrate-binding protein